MKKLSQLFIKTDLVVDQKDALYIDCHYCHCFALFQIHLTFQ